MGTWRRGYVQIALLGAAFAATGCELGNKSAVAPSAVEPSAVESPDAPAPSPNPIATMMGGTGFIFDGAQTTSGSGVDRDIWWNSAEIVPSHSASSMVTMVSLGQVDDLAAVEDLRIPDMTADLREPQVGEAYALAIRRPFDADPQYALVRFTQVRTADSNDLMFEYIYPR